MFNSLWPPWTVAYQAPQSMVFSRQESEWIAISFCRGSSQPRDRTGSPIFQADALPSEPPGKPNSMPRHILIKLTKTKQKEKILNAAREKQQVTYKGNPICLTADISAETLQARREWQDIFKVLKQKNLQPRLPGKDLIQNWWRNQKLSHILSFSLILLGPL